MKVGDLVVRTYGEGQRPTAIIVGWHSTGRSRLAKVMYTGQDRVVQIGTKHLEVISESR